MGDQAYTTTVTISCDNYEDVVNVKQKMIRRLANHNGAYQALYEIREALRSDNEFTFELFASILEDNGIIYDDLD